MTAFCNVPHYSACAFCQRLASIWDGPGTLAEKEAAELALWDLGDRAAHARQVSGRRRRSPRWAR